jgi:hypothetical protein
VRARRSETSAGMKLDVVPWEENVTLRGRTFGLGAHEREPEAGAPALGVFDLDTTPWLSAICLTIASPSPDAGLPRILSER